MATLAINGGTPVRATPYPSWPQTDDDEYVAAVDGGRSQRRLGRLPRARPARRRLRGGVRRLPGRSPRHLDDERHRDDGGRVQGARDRVGRRGHHPRVDVRRDGLRADGRRRAARHRRRHARHVDDRSRSGRGRDHGPHASDHPGAPRSSDGRHGPDHGDRPAPRPGRDRGLRARPRAAVEGPRRRLHRRLRFVQSPIVQDPDLGRRRHAADERRRRSRGAPTRSSTAGARRTPTRRTSRSARTTGCRS